MLKGVSFYDRMKQIAYGIVLVTAGGFHDVKLKTLVIRVSRTHDTRITFF